LGSILSRFYIAVFVLLHVVATLDIAILCIKTFGKMTLSMTMEAGEMTFSIMTLFKMTLCHHFQSLTAYSNNF